MENIIIDRLQRLANESKNIKTKRIINGILEMSKLNELPDIARAINESLSKLVNEDKCIAPYLNELNVREGLNNLGIKALINTTKKTKIYESDEKLQDLIEAAENNLANNQEYRLVNTFMPGIKTYEWNKPIKSAISIVESRIKKYSAYKAVQECIDELSDDNNSYLYESMLTKLNNAFSLPETQVPHYINTSLMEDREFHPAITKLITELKAMAKDKGNGGYSNLSKINYATDRHQGRVKAQERVSPMIMEDNRQVFLMNNKIYEVVPIIKGTKTNEAKKDGSKNQKSKYHNFNYAKYDVTEDQVIKIASGITFGTKKEWLEQKAEIEKEDEGEWTIIDELISLIDMLSDDDRRQLGRLEAKIEKYPKLYKFLDKETGMLSESVKEGKKLIREVKDYTTLPQDFLRLCESFLRFTQVNESLEISDSTFKYAVSINESNDCKLKVDDKEQTDELKDTLEELAMTGADPGTLNDINTIAQGADKIHGIENIITITPIDKGIVIDIIKLGTDDCDIYINVHDMSTGMDEMVNAEANPAAITGLKNNYGVDISPFVNEEEITEENKVDPEKQRELDELKEKLEEVEENLSKINSMDEAYQTDKEIQGLKKQLEESKTQLTEKIGEIETDISGEPGKQSREIIINQIIDDIKDIKTGIGNDEVSGKEHQIDNLVVTPTLQVELAENEGDPAKIGCICLTIDGVEDLASKFDGTNYTVEGNKVAIQLEEPITVEDELPVSLSDDIDSILEIIEPTNDEGKTIKDAGNGGEEGEKKDTPADDEPPADDQEQEENA